MTNLIKIENRAGKLKLNDAVHKESADKLIEELDRLYGPAAVAAQMVIGDIVCAADDALESVEISINSPGGSVFEGHRIYNALRGMSARGVEVRTMVDGFAASMGSVILMAGDVRSMTKQSQIMIHEASTMAWGDARTMKRNADLLESISSQIAGIYAERTGGDEKELRDLMYQETWMDSVKARELGFVHEVVDYGKKKDAKAEFDFGAANPKSVDMNLIAKFFAGKNEAEIEAALADIDALRTDLTAAQLQIESLKAQISGRDQAIAEHVASIASRDEKIQEMSSNIETITAELTQAKEEITAKEAEVEEAKASAGKQATEILATIGQPNPIPEGGNSVSILDQFNAITDPGERTRFYNANRSAILAAQAKAIS